MKRRNRVRMGLVGCMAAGGAVWAAAGCSRYDITIKCKPQINNFGLADEPSAPSAGRLLKVALVSLSESDLKKLSQTESFRGKMDMKGDPWTAITAEAWFTGGLEAKVRGIVIPGGAVQTPGDAVQTHVVKGDQTLKVKLAHPGPFGGRAGILALAHFSGAPGDEKNKAVFETAAWMPTRWKPHGFTLEVGPTTIKWAESR